MHLHEAFARELVRLGADSLFGLAGDANLYMIDSFRHIAGGRYVPAAHEGGAVLMASGYARVSGRVGVVTVTHGPAVTNTVTALAEGVFAQTPVLLIAGDTGIEDKTHLQNIAQREIFTSSGAGFEQARSAETTLEDLAVALRRTCIEMRPVVLNVPTDFWWQEIEYEPVLGQVDLDRASRPPLEAVEAAVAMMSDARRPVILAGAGASTPTARNALLKLSERLGAPVATSIGGKDLFRGEPFDLGLFGTLSTPDSLAILIETDCVIAFGAGLNPLTTAQGSLTAGRSVLHVDRSVGAIGKYTAVDLGIVGDAAATADAMCELLDEAEIPRRSFRDSAAARRVTPARATVKPVRQPKEGTIALLDALSEVERLVPVDRIVVMDAGRFMLPAMVHLRVPFPSAYVHTASFGSIGLGMGNAIGAAIGAPDRPVLLAIGDGGFMLGGLTEFNTAVRVGADLIVAVFNDGAYGAEYIQLERRGMPPDISTMEWPDFAPVAEALGGRGVTVRSLADFESVGELIEQRDRPLLIDIKIDPASVGEASH